MAEIVGGLVVAAVIASVAYAYSKQTRTMPIASAGQAAGEAKTGQDVSGIKVGNIGAGARVQIGTSNSSQEVTAPSTEKPTASANGSTRHSETAVVKSGISDTLTKLRGQESRTVVRPIIGTFERKGFNGKLYQLVFDADGGFRQLVDGRIVPGSSGKSTQGLTEGRIDVPGASWVVVVDEDHLRYQLVEYSRAN